MIKFNLQCRHSKRLAIVAKRTILILCNKTDVSVVSLSGFLIALYSPFLWRCVMIKCLCGEMKRWMTEAQWYTTSRPLLTFDLLKIRPKDDVLVTETVDAKPWERGDYRIRENSPSKWGEKPEKIAKEAAGGLAWLALKAAPRRIWGSASMAAFLLFLEEKPWWSRLSLLSSVTMLTACPLGQTLSNLLRQ